MRNQHPEFVGLDKIKEKQAWQLTLFEQWAASHEWDQIHENHYDWWMFPLDEPSRFGFAWTVFDEEIEELKKDSAFIQRYLRGAELLALAWGWNLKESTYVLQPESDQTWHNWPIRLYKAARSLLLFGFTAESESFCKYGRDRIAEGKNMIFNRRDLSSFFLAKFDI